MPNGGGSGSGTGAGAIQGTGTNAVNNLQPPIPMVYLRLSFIDPDGAVRAFPPGVPVTVLYGLELSPAGGGTQTYQTQANGDLRFPGWLATPCRTCTLQFRWTGQVPYFVCEAHASPPPAAACRLVTVAAGAADPPFLSVPAASPPPSPPSQERAFSLPPQWMMVEADWYDRGGGSRPFTLKGAFTGNGNYTPATGRISQTATPAADIGTAAAPIEFVLDPHWRMFRFDFFDRYYGDAALQSPPAAGHGRRIAAPPLWLEGFRSDPNAAGAAADTISNWTVGADPKDWVQCLPWILAKTNAGAPLAAVTGATMGMRFRTHQTQRSFIYSTSDTVREIRHVAAAAPELSPGPNRLRYYDLPRIWKCRKYYTRNLPGSPPADAKFFQTLTAADILNAEFKVTDTSVPRALVFCLDDIIMTQANLRQLAITAGQRVTVFYHKFANRRPDMPPGSTWPNLSGEGVHKPDATVGNVTQQGYPYSNVTMPPAALYYITDYADWTRLVAAQGNLYDVFDDRTPDVPANDVVGARAAVRWVDATTAPNGLAPVSPVLGTTGTFPGARPAITPQPFFTIQPYYEQRYLITYGGTNPQAGAIHHNEWSGAYPGAGPMGIGRFDLTHLRCCDWDGANEVSVVFRYLRLTVDFNTASNDSSGTSRANPLAGAALAVRQAWVQGLVDNCMARWNGNDAQSAARVWATPRPASPPAAAPALRTQIVTFFHYLLAAWSHSNIRCGDPRVTSFMGAWDGDAQIRINATIHDGGGGGNDAYGVARTGRGLAAAHELGHGMSLPDEYQSNPADQKMYAALNVLGSPYMRENRALMLFNWYIRARYLWYVAEWLRLLAGFGAVNFKLEHNDSAPPGAPRETNYFLPHYPNAGVRPRNFVSWPVAFNLRQRTGGDNSCFDSALYILGDDKYSSVVLPALAGGGARIDGLLIVLLRMRVDFSGVAGTTTAIRDSLYTAVSAAIEPPLNSRRFAAFQVVAGSPPSDPQCNRCLLHFEACYTTVGVAGGNSAAALNTSAPAHLQIFLATGAVAVPTLNTFTNNAPPAAKVLRITVPANFVANFAADIPGCAALIFQYACTTLGLNSAVAPAAGSFQTPASYTAIVRTVMDAGTPNPVIT